jgi:hypothetical protein
MVLHLGGGGGEGLITAHHKNSPCYETFHKASDVKEESRMGIFEGMMSRRISGPKKDGVTGSGEEYITRSCVICTTQGI